MKIVLKIAVLLFANLFLMSNVQAVEICSGQVVIPNIANGADVDPATIAKFLGRTPKNYVPFTITEVQQWLTQYNTATNPATGVEGSRIVTIDANNFIVFQEYIRDKQGTLVWVTVSIGGILDDFLIKINDFEKEMTAIGYSVRDSQTDATFANVHMLYTDPIVIREQLIRDLRLKATVALLKCADTIPANNCPQFDLQYTLNNLTAQLETIKELPDGKQQKIVETINTFDANQVVTINGNEVTISDLITTANVSAKVGCALGLNLFNAIPNYQVSTLPGISYPVITWNTPMDIRGFGLWLLQGLDLKLKALSCPEFLCDTLANIKFPWSGSGSTTGSSGGRWWEGFFDVNLGDFSSFEKFSTKIMKNILSGLSTKLDIPDLTNMPVLEPPVYPKLDLRKTKEWEGINEGDTGIAAVTSSAYYKLYGSETAQAAVAFGHFSIWLVNNEINVVSASADFFTGASTKANILGSSIPTTTENKLLVYSNIKLQYLGKSWSDTRQASTGTLNITAGPKTPKQLFKFELAYTQRFMVGPVPVELKMGGFFQSGITWKAGIVPLKMYASIVPNVSATAFVKAFAGISGFVGVGAGGDLAIIKATVPLTGAATLAFSGKGEPYLDLSIESIIEVTKMSGSIYIWAEYYVPRWGIPPWKKEKKSKTLMSFNGNITSYPLFDWGMEIGYRGLIMRGSLIDQQDLAMAEKLQSTINIYNRADAISIYLAETNTRLIDFYGKLNADLLAETVDVPSTAQSVVLASSDFETNLSAYKCKMQGILGQPCL